eukprot:1013261_1
MFRCSTIRFNEKKNNNIITSNSYQTPNFKQSNTSNAFYSLLNPFSVNNNKHNTNQTTNTFSPNDLVINQEENVIQTNKLNKRININNFITSTPCNYPTKLNGNQSTILYN